HPHEWFAPLGYASTSSRYLCTHCRAALAGAWRGLYGWLVGLCRARPVLFSSDDARRCRAGALAAYAGVAVVVACAGKPAEPPACVASRENPLRCRQRPVRGDAG